jgi:hypothetical protein
MNRISEQQEYDGMYDELSREEAEHFYNHLYRTISIGKDPHNDCYSFNKIERGGRSFEKCIRQYLNYYDGPVRFFVMNDPSYDIEKMHRIRTESKNMNKKLIRLTESDLHKIVMETVDKLLKEDGYSYNGMQIQNDLRNQVETTWNDFQKEREKSAANVLNSSNIHLFNAAVCNYITKYYGKGYREGDKIDNRVIKYAIQKGFAKTKDDVLDRAWYEAKYYEDD